MVRAIRGPVRLNYGCWGLTLTPLKTSTPDFTFIMSVPKRLLRLAVWRNQARRVARESWRSCKVLTQMNASIDSEPLKGYSLMLRLTQRPVDQLTKSGVSKDSIGAGKVKQKLREDCDALLELLSGRISN